MKNATALAYARAYAVTRRAIERAGGKVGNVDAVKYPVRAYVEARTLATTMQALSDYDEELVQYYLKQAAPDSLEDGGKAVSAYQQSLTEFALNDWHDMTPKEAADVLGVTESRVRALIKNDQLDAVKVGGKWFVNSRSVHQRVATPIPRRRKSS